LGLKDTILYLSEKISWLLLGTTNVRGVRVYDMVPQHTNYLRYLKRGEDKMTWGEKVGKNKRAIIKYGIKDNLTLAG
jgi:hypothetical protein